MKRTIVSKKKFISCCHRIASRDLIWGASGNISMRCGRDAFYITASGSMMGGITVGDIAQCSVTRKTACTRIIPSVEHNMHRIIYKKRSDVNVILHVHPLFSVLMISAKNASIRTNIIPEAEAYLGNIQTVPYIKAGTQKLADEVGEKIEKASLLILKNHGIVAVGKTFDKALCALEAFEFIAKLNYYAHIAKLTLRAL